MTSWILLVGAVIVALGYVLVMRDLFQRSRELDQQVDSTKIRPWKDEDD